MKVLEQVHARPDSSRSGYRLCQALEEIAALLRSRQVRHLRKIGKNSPKTWCNLSQFSCVGPHLPTVIIQARCLRHISFDDLGEREVRMRFVSFVAAPYRAAETIARRVLRHLHRQPGFADAGSIVEHDNRSLAGSPTIDCCTNGAFFILSSHKSSPLRQ